MPRLHPLLTSVLALAFLGPPQAIASGLAPAAVTFAPEYMASFKKKYGDHEIPVLRSEVARAVSQSLKAAGGRCSRQLDVTIERAAPTTPTIKQQMDDPTLSPFRTVNRDSGASLKGHVLGPEGHVLETVEYGHFNGYTPGLSPARDPWSEARVAIEAFSTRLVNACVKQSAATSAAP